MAVTPPTSQKNLRISFAFIEPGKAIRFTWLAINPEELTRAEPSRTNVVNSLDGAWVDSFGRGLTTLTISGNTGWRGRTGTDGENRDGINRFVLLRDEYIHAWHTARSAAIENGEDPSGIQMIFVDPLNGPYVAEVAPISFTLRRSKSQPLLMMYSLTMTVVSDQASVPYQFLLDPLLPVNDKDASNASMLKSIDKISSLQKGLRGALGSVSSLGASVHKWTDKAFSPVINAAKEVIQTAADAKAVISSTGKIAIDLARDMSAVGTQLWGAVAAVTSLPNAIKSQVMQIKSEFSNLNCVLANGYKSAYQAESYASWYGSSNCSSTLGGASSALSGNPFETASGLVPAKVSDAAAKAIIEIKNADKAGAIDPDLKRKVNVIIEGVS